MDLEVSPEEPKRPKSAKTSVWYGAQGDIEEYSYSKLAILETIIAIAIYTFIAVRYGTLHLALSACIAPLLLLRTEDSTKLGIEFGNRIFGLHHDIFNEFRHVKLVGPLSFFVIGLPMLGILILLTRFTATVTSLIKRPLSCISNIPRNWVQIVFKIDSSIEPVALPGLEKGETVLGGISSSTLKSYEGFRFLRNKKFDPEKPFLEAIALIIVFTPILSFISLPPLIYRYSLKGTALLLSPFIFIAHSASTINIENYFRNVISTAIHKIRLIYAGLYTLAFATKFSVLVGILTIGANIQNTRAKEIFNAYFVPDAIPPWQYASLINCILAVSMFFIADFAVTNIDRDKGWDAVPLALDYFVRIAKIIAGVLTIYTIACTVYIAYTLVPGIDWPPLGTRVFPWL